MTTLSVFCIPLISLAGSLLRSALLAIRFIRNPRKTDIAYLVEASPSLTDWTEILYNSDSDRMIITDSPAIPESPRRFLRLRVDKN